MLIESDMVAKAILDLIHILNIRKLVVGTTKFNPSPRYHTLGVTKNEYMQICLAPLSLYSSSFDGCRKLLKSRRGIIPIADQIFRSAPITCEVKVVCEGKEVISQMIGSPSPGGNEYNFNFKALQLQEAFSCICFRPKF